MAKAKEALLWTVLLAFCVQVLNAENREPQVQVYTRFPVEVGKENTLHCYADKFHPPKINITILKNDQPMAIEKNDLSFHNDWSFHLLAYTKEVIDGKSTYNCKVEHETLKEPKIVKFDLDY
ncbi:beta-2-microglobulin [Eublepharis macularius]|uniref:Beta-2-microglobulin n=1 Tax=Eublepharis macularius TaxID=481883 RepID=A0AA97LLV6_EUBMA|nr:beta-2-microglobulin [Eublepharis macularius]